MTPAQFRTRRARAQAKALAVQQSPQSVGWWLAASGIAIATLMAVVFG